MVSGLGALDGLLFGVGLLLAATGAGIARRRGGRAGDMNRGLRPRRSAARKDTFAVVAACLTGALAYALTRWPMSAPLTALAVVGMRRLGRSGAKTRIERLEAIAVWTEMLRDTLAGAAGLTQALVTTAGLAPRPLRPPLLAMAARLSAGVALPAALSQLADDVADPAADVVVASLVLAATERAQRLGDLLGALAEATRAEVTMRLGVEAARASARTAVRMIAGSSFALLALMAVVARPYLAPYRSPQGQVVLAVVGCLYGLGLRLMTAMARPRDFPRLRLSVAPAS